MSEAHYKIALKKGVDKEQIVDELTRDTTSDASVDSNVIPDRKVQFVDERKSSKRIVEMALRPEEVAKLRADDRIGDIEHPFEWSDDFLDYELNPRTNWTRASSSTANRNNWGLLRHIESTNGWGTNHTQSRSSEYYTGHLDGTGVDYIHQEGGIPRPDHEYLEDANGSSRLQQLQWNTLPNCSGAGTMFYNTNVDASHATHCCGTAIGKGVGWGTGATVYFHDLSFLNQSYWFDTIKEFHKAKSVDPVTGVKRPTVVSASWGYKANFSSITNIVFRGTNTGTTTKDSDYGMIGDPSNRFNAAIYSLSAEVEEMQDEGVIYCKSAGNQYQKLCYSTDIDYNNYITRSVSTGGISAGSPVYYNRGAGNIGKDTIVVGNLDDSYSSTFAGINNQNGEYTAGSSDKGPRVDIWAAGTNIVSGGTGATNSYYNNSGTSMATPQIAGMCTLLLQMNPGMTPAQVRAWFQNNAITGLMNQGSTNENDPATFFSGTNANYGLMNGPNRIAYWPFSAHRPLTSTVSGNISF